MKIFLDTGNLKEIEAMMPLGIVDGVTTNPSLMAKEGGDPRAIIKSICDVVQGPVSAEVVATDWEGMVREDVISRPSTPTSSSRFRSHVMACARPRVLADEGIRVNVTLIFSATQALIAAKVGAAYVSPFVGRLDDIASDGMGLIRSRRSVVSRSTDSRRSGGGRGQDDRASAGRR